MPMVKGSKTYLGRDNHVNKIKVMDMSQDIIKIHIYTIMHKQKQKQWKNIIHNAKRRDQLSFKSRFPKIGLT